MLQDDTPCSVHIVLLLVNKDSSLRLDKPAAIQVTPDSWSLPVTMESDPNAENYL